MQLIHLLILPTVARHSFAFERLQDWLESLQTQGYDHFTTPAKAQGGQGGSTRLDVEIYVESMGNYQPKTMDFDMDVYFIQHWKDHRLKHERGELALNDPSLISLLWQPDLYFANSKSAQTNMLTVPNLAFVIYPDGQVRYSMRISLKVSCHMDLKAYPLDSQTCYLRTLPYGNSVDVLEAHWRRDRPDEAVQMSLETFSVMLQINPDIAEADLRLVSSQASTSLLDYYGRNYSSLLLTFHLKRDISSSLLQTYLPTVFIVVISWMSFWIDPSSVPGRVALAITTLLTLATQAAGIRLGLPPVAYAKALDFWLGMCMLFLFGVLLEFAVVNRYERKALEARIKKNHKDAQGGRRNAMAAAEEQSPAPPCETVVKTRIGENQVLIPTQGTEGGAMRKRPGGFLQAAMSGDVEEFLLHKKALRIDKIARLAFPSAFLLFNIAYWTAYLV